MENAMKTPNGSRQRIAFVAIILALAGYAAWTTSQIIRLETRLNRLEMSHDTLGRYTYDFGAAVAPARDERKTYVPFDADSILSLMRNDPLLGPMIDQPRARNMPIQTTHSTHNWVKQPVR